MSTCISDMDTVCISNLKSVSISVSGKDFKRVFRSSHITDSLKYSKPVDISFLNTDLINRSKNCVTLRFKICSQDFFV
jgi:hypothetical protein